MSKTEERVKKLTRAEEESFAESLLAGSQPTTGGSKRIMIETLQDMFGGDDLVIVKNFTKEKVGWVYSDRREVKLEQPNEYTRRVWQGSQKVRVLAPGEEKVVPGWEAYVGLVRFYKQWVQENGDLTLMNSPANQSKFLAMAYKGTYDPNEVVVRDAEKDAEKEVEADIKAEVDKDLGLAKDDKEKA